jgi:hypothetical protein
MATGIKTGGRSKGTPNRNSAETKELLQTVLDKELDKLGILLGKLEPLDRVNAIAKLLPYILPRQNEVKAEIANTNVIGDEFTEQNQARLDFLIEKALSMKK